MLLFQNIKIAIILLISLKMTVQNFLLIKTYNAGANFVKTISMDRNYATMAVHSSISSNIYSFSQYDIALNSQYSLATNVQCSLSFLRQRKGFNNLTKNFFMAVNAANTSVFSFNLSTLHSSWMPNSLTTIYNAHYGDQGQYYFEYLTVSGNFQMYKKYVLNSSINASVTLSGQVYIDSILASPRIYVLTQLGLSASAVKIRIYDQVAFSLIAQVLVNTSSSNSSRMKFCVESPYLLFVQPGSTAYLYNITTSFVPAWNRTINFTIDYVGITTSTIIVSSGDSLVQYRTSDLKQIGRQASPIVGGYLMSVNNNGSWWMGVWKTDSPAVYFYNVSNNYGCVGCSGCVCQPAYCFDSGFTTCIYNGDVTLSCNYVFNSNICTSNKVTNNTGANTGANQTNNNSNSSNNNSYTNTTNNNSSNIQSNTSSNTTNNPTQNNNTLSNTSSNTANNSTNNYSILSNITNPINNNITNSSNITNNYNNSTGNISNNNNNSNNTTYNNTYPNNYMNNNSNIYPNNTVNNSNSSIPYPNHTAISTNSSNNTQTSNTSTTNLTYVYNTNTSVTIFSTFYCTRLTQYNRCQSYCRQSCSQCQPFSSDCLACTRPYLMNQASNSCDLPQKLAVATIFINYFNSFRVNRMQRVYFTIDDFKFHVYHKVEYKGIIRYILDYITFLQSVFWDMLSQMNIDIWVNEPFTFQNYSAFTNIKFQQVERSDSFFIQTTKQYFFFYLPLIFAFFVILNKIFYILFNYKISICFRIYSFWLNFFMIGVIQNWSTIVFYACHHFTHMFSFDQQIKFSQVVSIILIGLLFKISISLFFLCEYAYHNQSSFFLVNMYKTNGSSFLMMIRFVAKPMIEAVVHVYLYQNPQIQYLLLICSNLFVFILYAILELYFKIFKTKGQFLFDSLLDVNIALLNMSFYMKYILFQNLQQLFQICTVAFVYFHFALLISDALYSLVCMFFQIIKKKKNKKQVKNVRKERKIKGGGHYFKKKRDPQIMSKKLGFNPFPAEKKIKIIIKNKTK